MVQRVKDQALSLQQLGCCCGTGWIPALGTSYATGMALKETDWKPGLVPALPVTDSMTEGKIFMFSC